MYPVKVCARSASLTLNLISTFLLLSLDRNLCWIFSPRGDIHPVATLTCFIRYIYTFCIWNLPFRSTWVHRPVFSGVRVTRSLVLCVCFVDRCLSFCTFSFGHCVVCSSSIYGFCVPFVIFWPLCCLFFFDIWILFTLWYLQTLLTILK